MFLQSVTNAPYPVGDFLPVGVSTGARIIPWWSGGYSKLAWFFGVSPQAAGSLNVQVTALDADLNPMARIADDLFAPIVTDGNVIYWTLQLNDGPLPGNIAWTSEGIDFPAQSLNLNPAWNKAAHLKFEFNNTTGLTMQILNNSILLAGQA